MAANNIYIQVDFNSQTAQQNVNALNQSIAQTGPTAQKSSQQATQAVNSVSVSVQHTTRAFGELTTALAGLGVGRVVAGMVQIASELGRAQQMMTYFIGSAEDARKVFEEIRAVANQGIFRFKDLEETGRRLAGFGMQAKEIPATLKIITDQVTAMGGSMEDVNSIVAIFGRVMAKDFVSAMDLIRKLPAEGVKVMTALKQAMSTQLGRDVSTEEVKKYMKEGVLDPMETLRTILQGMKQQTGGAGASVNDAAKSFKVLGDQAVYAATELAGPKGFGPAIENLARELQNLAAPLAGVIAQIEQLPEETKERIVNIAALTAAFTALGTALGIIVGVAEPLLGLVGTLGKLTVALISLNPELIAAAVAIAALAFAIYKFSSTDALNKIGDAIAKLGEKFKDFNLVQEDAIDKWVLKHLGLGDLKMPSEKDVKKAVGDWVGEFSKTLKDKFAELAAEGQKLMGSIFKPPPEAAGGYAGVIPGTAWPIGPMQAGTTQVLKENLPEKLEEVQRHVQEWSDQAGKTLLQALNSPAEAVLVKYRDLFNKLEKMLQEKVITGEDAAKIRRELLDARALETEAKLFEKKKQDIAEQTKLDVERIKGSYEAQIAYIEALDEQDLRKKVAAIDRITDLRVRSAQAVAKVEDNQLQQVFEAQKLLLEANRELFEKAGIDVDEAIAARHAEMVAKQQVIDQKAFDDAQKYRLEGWKKANDAIIEDQKRVYEVFKSGFDEIFDAFTQKTKSIGQALGDVFKKLALGEARNLFSSQAAAFATEAAGYGRPTEQITRGGGILSVLLGRGMPPRPPGPPPESYNPARGEGGVTFPEAGGKGSASRIADAAGVYNVSSIVFSNAVNRFSDATISHQGSADRMVESSADISEASDAIQKASSATGVSEPLLRAVARAESNLIPGAIGPLTRSGERARGLFQLMPGTAADLGVTDLFNPYQSALGGAQYLQKLLTRYGGDIPSALAAYNMGPAKYDRYIARGRALPAETQAYVARALSYMAAPEAPTFTARATREFPMPPGFSVQAGQLTYSPTLAAAQMPELPPPPDIFGGAVTAGATPSEIAQAKQAGILTRIPGVLGTSVGTMGGGGGTTQAGLGRLMHLQNLKDLFGIGGTAAGRTTLGSVLTSRGVADLSAMAGMALISAGVSRRAAPLTVAGGALAGIKLGQMMGMGWLQGPLTGAGLGLFMAGVQRGGFGGMAMDIGGGALAGGMIGLRFGGPMGAAIGAAIGAGVGAITGIVRLFVKTEQERIRQQIKQVYGIDISNRGILTQIQQIIDQKYGGSVSVGVRSEEIQDLVRLYALSTGQAANMPRPMYAATIAQSTQGLQLQPVYQGGVQVQNPYTGPTTYQYQSAVASAMGLRAGTSLGVPGASGLITDQWQKLMVQTIQGNPSAIAMANSAAASAGDSRLTTTQAMQEPLTLLS